MRRGFADAAVRALGISALRGTFQKFLAGKGLSFFCIPSSHGPRARRASVGRTAISLQVHGVGSWVCRVFQVPATDPRQFDDRYWVALQSDVE